MALEVKYTHGMPCTAPKKREQQYSLGNILARDYEKSHKKLSGGGSMFKTARASELHRLKI